MNQSVKTRAKRRFNAVDAVVILLVLAVIAGAVWLFDGSGIFGSGENVTIEYQILVRDVRNDIATHITSDVTVVEATKHYCIGTVGDGINVAPYCYEVYVDELYDENGNLVSGASGDGERVETEKPGYVMVYLPVTATANVRSDGYYVNGYKISVGSQVFFRLPDFAGNGYVCSLNVIANGGNAQ